MAKSTIICPYCFEKSPSKNIQFRCTNKLCKLVDDVEMTRYENGDIRTPKKGQRTFVTPKPGAARANCPDCGNATTKQVCPKCHNPLPESTLSGKDMIISVVGGRATGKSHFVGVLIKELTERISVSFGGAMEGFDDSYKRWESGFYSHLYVDGMKLDLTKSSLQNVNNGAYRPLIFKLKLPHKSFLGSSIDSFTFVFFDTAGEDLNDADTMSTVNKYICQSAGIIFLLDPVQIPAVASQIDAGTAQRAAGGVDYRLAARADDIMTRVSNLIRNDRGWPENRKIDIPVAAVFSKFDVIEPLVPRESILHTNSPHCATGQLVLSDWNEVNQDVKGLLQAWNASAFTSQLETNYTTYSYFTASALGLNNNPTAAGRIERPRPHRIEDPLLWLMYKNGVIKGR